VEYYEGWEGLTVVVWLTFCFCEDIILLKLWRIENDGADKEGYLEGRDDEMEATSLYPGKSLGLWVKEIALRGQFASRRERKSRRADCYAN
jgi:hypothetical protein